MSDGVVLASGVVAIGSPDPTQPVTGTTITATTTFLMPSGTATSPGWQWSADNDGTGTGMYRRVADTISISATGTGIAEFSATALAMASTYIVAWNSGALGSGLDSGLERGGAGIVKVTNGAGSLRQLQSQSLYVGPATAIPAGGNTTNFLAFSSTANFGIFMGSGVPTISAAQGSIYIRSDGSTTTSRAYINNSAGSGTTWTAITTVA